MAIDSVPNSRREEMTIHNELKAELNKVTNVTALHRTRKQMKKKKKKIRDKKQRQNEVRERRPVLSFIHTSYESKQEERPSLSTLSWWGCSGRIPGL